MDPTLANLKLVRAHQNMLLRCSTACKQRKDYIDRGIRVCDEWRTDIRAFMRDVGLPPSPEHTLERIDNNGNYEPSNVEWATRIKQNRNSRHNNCIVLDQAEGPIPISQAAERLGLTRQTLSYRVHKYGKDDPRTFAPTMSFSDAAKLSHARSK